MGLVLGVGFLNREFTIYGAAALVALDLVRANALHARCGDARYALAFGTAACVWIAFLLLRQFSSAAGPGTSVADLHTALAGNNLLQVAERLCFDVRAMAVRRGPHLHRALAGAVRSRAAAADRFRDRERRPAGTGRQRLAAVPCSAFQLAAPSPAPGLRNRALRRQAPTAAGFQARHDVPVSETWHRVRCTSSLVAALSRDRATWSGDAGSSTSTRCATSCCRCSARWGSRGGICRSNARVRIAAAWAACCAAIFTISVSGACAR